KTAYTIEKVHIPFQPTKVGTNTEKQAAWDARKTNAQINGTGLTGTGLTGMGVSGNPLLRGTDVLRGVQPAAPAPTSAPAEDPNDTPFRDPATGEDTSNDYEVTVMVGILLDAPPKEQKEV